MHRLLLGSSLLAGFLVATAPRAADPEPKPYTPNVRPASDEGAKAMKGFRMPKGVEVRLWAAEPLLANPVSFCFDEKGRCYVAETFRLSHGVTDNRSHMNWLDDDLASRTVADRVAMHKKYAKGDFGKIYETDHDRVRLIEDTTGKGVADKATVFADGFKDAATGLGAGVLARKGNVYYTCIPDLWLLQDTKGTGKADVKKSLATGFGIHVAFIGHDMHGLRMGPDGRLYFSIGDRGFNVTTKEGKHLFNPDSGAVLRCEPDGSNLEIVHMGLRNPQELAFDPFGNLFTVDNNSDSGDKARLVQIVEGGDSGWRTGYQYGSSLSDRGPFNAEKIWHLQHEGQPAYIVPPLAHITSGPSGFCFNYGATALPERYKDHFFICDFRGSPGGSSIYSFAVKPKGASFEPVDGHNAFGGVLATDCDFGPDGGFYVSDWVDGWGLTGKGRIYRFAYPEADKKAILAETKKLLAEGFDKRSNEELAKLLEHPDIRVRQEAQFALVGKGIEVIPSLERVARQSKNRLAKIHAIWGLGELGRKSDEICSTVTICLMGIIPDEDRAVRTAVIKVWGEMRNGGDAFIDAIEKSLKDDDSRLRYEAIIALAKQSRRLDVTRPLIVAMLRENNDRDAYLRHAGVIALSIWQSDELEKLADDSSPAVRGAALLALRRRGSNKAARFLNDATPQIAVEAARAIHDLPILDDLPQLAEHLVKPNQPEFLLWRALNANFRLGKAANAAAVAAFAARAGAPEKMRVDAVKMLGEWAKPGRRDHVTGLTQNLGERDAAIAVAALKANLAAIFTGPDAVRKEATTVAAKLGIKEVAPVLFDVVADTKQPPATRVEAIRALETLKDARLEKAREIALSDGDPRVRTEGRRQLAKVKPAEALPLLAKVVESGSLVERQGAFAILAEMKGTEVDEIISKSLGDLLKNQVPPEVHLDLLEAAAKRQVGGVKDKLTAFEKTRSKTDELAKWSETLVGGDAERGRYIFLNKAEVTCQKCHKVNGIGGDVGPELTGIGAKQKRDYLLESLVLPNKQIAKGYETVVLQMTNGKSVIGIVKAEDAKEVRLMTAEGQLVTVPKNTIDERTKGKSAMPEDVTKHLSKAELRDLVEFLASLKDPPKGP
jgi:quinoprotein glucose dehydrogenase